MPEELFVPAIGIDTNGLCPICTLVKINQLHGLPLDTLPTGEVASSLLQDAWQYYKPTGKNIYKI